MLVQVLTVIIYLLSKNNIQQANLIIEDALTTNPRNLILNQLRSDLQKSKNLALADKFNCKNISHVVAEILYISANALSSQNIYEFSNFYLNLSKYLNKNFHSFNTLLAENFYKTKNFDKAKKIYNEMGTKGKIFLKASLVASISSKFSAVYLHGMYNKAYTLCHIVKAI